MKLIVLLAMTLTCQIFALNAQTITEQSLVIGMAKSIEFPSTVLQQNRTIKVYLPEGYDKSTQTYPTLYLLDGERHLAHAVLASRLHQEQGNIPKQIIVAINNLEQDSARENDFYHHRDKFAQFIGTELQPFIDKTFRSSKSATLYGHSLAAYFAVDLLASQPALFDRYIAASPPLQRHANDIYQQLLGLRLVSGKTLYITMAEPAMEEQQAYHAYLQFTHLLSSRPPSSLTWQTEVMSGESHISNYYITLFKGLAAAFKG
ncbi:alpha/beta hydrolase [Pseudoalteromonas maricaloris]|uniref:alpha/beta hydrolase n=1 Tax=Pseudoalteromonas maricaloris TaxID=184924 RepID=UPI00029B4F9E|nr:alpha/beta hydrolase-fold protein [Pseudoalteromonas flavipulchra]